MSFFNSHYDNACYLPMMGFVTFNDEAEQFGWASNCVKLARRS